VQEVCILGAGLCGDIIRKPLSIKAKLSAVLAAIACCLAASDCILAAYV
jgi:hypothetical protein